MAKRFGSAIAYIQKEADALVEKIKTNDAQALAYEQSAKIHRQTAEILREEHDDLQAAIRLLEGAFDKKEDNG